MVTKNLEIDIDIKESLNDMKMWEKFDKVVSRERVRDELHKMFKFDTFKSLNIFKYLPETVTKNIIFKNDIWLKSTTEKK